MELNDTPLEFEYFLTETKLQMQQYIFCVLLLCLALNATGQKIEGTISTEFDGSPLMAAEITWVETGRQTISFEDGYFYFELGDAEGTQTLVVSYLGHQTDTFSWSGEALDIRLKESEEQLDEVTVSGRSTGSGRDANSIASVEVINQTELSKSACCDLAGCFETTASVRSQTTNVITSAKELQILGLSGVYNQVLLNGLPFIQGLSYTYGLSTYPGTLIENIWVAKGANSVRQGYDGVAGQINMQTLCPGEADALFANIYVNSFGESQYNLHSGFRLGKESDWKMLIGGHMTQPAVEIDRDKDEFLDVTRIRRYSLFNHWEYQEESDLGWHTSSGLRYVNEERIGGQTGYDPDQDRFTTNRYGQEVDFQQFDLFSKTQYKWNEKHLLSLDFSAFYHEQRSSFGTLSYNGMQYFANAVLQHEWTPTPAQKLSWGTHIRVQDLSEEILFAEDPAQRTYDGIYETDYTNVGLFAEYQWSFWEDKTKWLVGGRLDVAEPYGTFWTGRSQVRIEPIQNHVFRLSTGNAWRQVNLFAENIQLLAGNRDVIIEEWPLDAEQSWNWGVNYTYTLAGEDWSAYISADYYQTRFSNQFFPDYDREVAKAFISNTGTPALSNAFQIEGRINWNTVWEVKAAYNYLDIRREQEGGEVFVPFIPRHRIMAALSYRPEGDRWYFDLNAHYYGPQRLPNTDDYPVVLQRGDFSPDYAVLNAQITYKWSVFEFYGGVENALDFRQLRPILNWQNPFEPTFDPAFIWGPTRGREFYLGIRYRIP